MDDPHDSTGPLEGKETGTTYYYEVCLEGPSRGRL